MKQSIDDLANLVLGTPEISATELEPGFPVLEVKAAGSSATIALQGAQVLTWVPKDQPGALYVSPRAKMTEGVACRGGIPICWPWFGKHPEEPDFPSHGFARTMFWEFVEGEVVGSMVRLIFRLESNEETKKYLEQDFELTATVTVSDKLRVKLQMKNLSEEPFKVSCALHSYLSVGDIEKIQLEGVKGAHYVDKLLPEDAEAVYQEKNLQIKGEVDRIYDSMSSVLLRDLERGRSVFVDKAGSKSTVIWNPWKERSKELADLPDKGYREFVCVEVANAGKDQPTLRQNSTHTIETVMGLRPLG